MHEISISEAVHRIQQELIESQLRREHRGVPPLFQLKSIEIEMQVAIKTVESTKGGVDIKVVSVQLGDDIASEAVHKVKIALDVIPGAVLENLPGVFPDRSDSADDR